MFVVTFPEIERPLYLCWHTPEGKYVAADNSKLALVFQSEEEANDALMDAGNTVPGNAQIIKAGQIK